VFIRNKTSTIDEPRYEKISRIPEEDEMFSIKDDLVLPIGKDAGELNLIILIPKTDKRSSDEDVSLNKLLESRVKNPEALKTLTENYTGKNSLNLKKVRLKADVYSLETNQYIGSSISRPIFDTASKAHGAMDLHDATPLRSCAVGGRKIVMIAEFGLAKDVEPRFQLYNSDGERLKDQEEKFLRQPSDRPGKSVLILKETIIFITPEQPFVEMFIQNDWKVKLVARRLSDGLVSKTKFDFDIVPHDYYCPGGVQICPFCEIDPDKQMMGEATIAPMRDVARPGLRKRKMSGTDIRDFSDKQESSSSPSPCDSKRMKGEESPSGSVSPASSYHAPFSPPSIDITTSSLYCSPKMESDHQTVSISLPSTVAFQNILTSNATRNSILQNQVENMAESSGLDLRSRRGEHIKQESEEVPFHDLNNSKVVRMFNTNIGDKSSLVFPK